MLDNESLNGSAAFPDIESNYFEDDEQISRMPHWICDNDLRNSETETLSAAEEQFWFDLIERYLQPLEPTNEEKVHTHISFLSISILKTMRKTPSLVSFLTFRNEFELIYHHFVI